MDKTIQELLLHRKIDEQGEEVPAEVEEATKGDEKSLIQHTKGLSGQHMYHTPGSQQSIFNQPQYNQKNLTPQLADINQFDDISQQEFVELLVEDIPTTAQAKMEVKALNFKTEPADSSSLSLLSPPESFPRP